MRQPHKRLLIAVIPLFACAAALRWWQLSSAFEVSPRLAIPFAPASVLLAVLLLAAAVLLAILARRQQVSPELDGCWERALYAPEDRLHLTGLVLAAFLSLAAGVILLIQGIRLFQDYRMLRAMGEEMAGANNGLLRLLTGAAGLASFPALLAAAKNAMRRGRCGNLPLMSAVCACLWMMDAYRSHAADPVLWDYVPLILAIAAGLLFYLHWAGLTCGTPHPRRALWLAGMTVVLSAAAMVGEDSLGAVLLLASQAFAALCMLYRLPRNLKYPPEASDKAPEPEEKVEEEPHE